MTLDRDPTLELGRAIYTENDCHYKSINKVLFLSFFLLFDRRMSAEPVSPLPYGRSASSTPQSYFLPLSLFATTRLNGKIARLLRIEEWIDHLWGRWNGWIAFL